MKQFGIGLQATFPHAIYEVSYETFPSEVYETGEAAHGEALRFSEGLKVTESPEVTVSLDSPASLVPVRAYLRDHATCQFKQVVERAAVDYPGRAQRFDLVYCLLSRHFNARRKVVVRVDELTPVPTITHLFRGAGWLEREVYDRHGIFFEGNTDLRRLLTDYGFQGHPLRKDFPLTGYYEVRYDELEKRVLYEAVETAQEFRGFQFNNPWVVTDEPDAKHVGEGSGIPSVSAPRAKASAGVQTGVLGGNGTRKRSGLLVAKGKKS